MSDIDRQLVSLEVIHDIEKHDNADNLEILKIKGWEVVAQKGIHKIGDTVVYFEVDSFLPIDPRYEFLRKSSYRSNSTIGEGFRIKTIKLRGRVSQGLVMPLTEYGDISGDVPLAIQLSVKKWEIPLSPTLSGIMAGLFPSHLVPKTDEERVQNLTIKEIQAHKNDVFEVSVKMDGSSGTFYAHTKEDGTRHFGVCSRNYELKEDDTNIFWKMVKKYGLDLFLKDVYYDIDFAIQGEVVGPGIQKNPHGLTENKLFIFNLYNIKDKIYATSTERQLFIKQHNYILQLDGYSYSPLESVELLPTNNGILIDTHVIDDKYKDIKFNNKPVEGVVFKSLYDPFFSYKYIFLAYLLNEKD